MFKIYVISYYKFTHWASRIDSIHEYIDQIFLKRGLFQRKGTKRGPHLQKGSPRGPGSPLGDHSMDSESIIHRNIVSIIYNTYERPFLTKTKFLVINYKSDGITTSFMFKWMSFLSENNQNKRWKKSGIIRKHF